MQLTSIVLIFQVYITAAFYESYKPVSDKEKEVRARLNQKWNINNLNNSNVRIIHYF